MTGSISPFLSAAKQVLSTCILLELIAGTGRAITPANSSFEVSSNGFAVGWTKTSEGGQVSLNTVPRNAFTGNNSIKAGGGSAGVRSEPISVTPGRHYVASIKFRLESGAPGSLCLEYRDATGALISGQSYSANGKVITGAWQTITVIPQDPKTCEVLPAPADATQATLRITGSAADGVAYFDNAVLTEVAEVRVPNSRLGRPGPGELPDHWRRATKIAKAKKSGASVSECTGVASDPIPVIPGRKYTGTIHCKAPAGTEVYLYLDYWNREGTRMLTYSTEAQGSGSWQTITVTPEEPVSKEQIVAPYGASYLTLTVFSPAGQFDSIQLDSALVLVNDLEFATAGVIAANPGFEKVDSAGFPLEWTKVGNRTFETGSSARAAEGGRSLRIHDTSGSEMGGVESKRFSVIEGKTYTVGAKYFIESTSANPQFRLGIRFYDNETDLTPRSYTPDEYLGFTEEPMTSQGAWQELAYDFKPPFLAKYASVVITSTEAGQGDGYFDSVSVAAKASGLSNGSFEDWDLNGYPHSWSSYHNSAQVVTQGSTARHSDIARSLKISDSSTTEGGGARSNRITSVTAGLSYTASASIYLESGSLRLYVEFWDSNNRRLSESHASAAQIGSWQTVDVAAIAPPGTAYATILLYSTVAGTCEAFADAVTFSSDVVNVTDRRQLFIDDYLIKSLDHVTKEVHPATIVDDGKPVLVHDSTKAPWESNYYLCYGSVVFDPLDTKYKLFYTTNGFTCCAYSDDGITGWSRPDLGVVSFHGNKHNNIVAGSAITGREGIPGIGLSVLIDPREGAASPKRYRSFAEWHFDRSHLQTDRPAWYTIQSSQDGKTFSHPIDTVNGWDVSTMAFDPANSQFVASVKYYDNTRRVHRMTTSTDGTTWSIPIRNESLSDTVDSVGHVESDSYGIGWYPYDGTYIGFDWVFQIDAGLDSQPGHQQGLISPELVFSRDLAEAWYRPSRIPIIPRGAPGTWNAGVCYTASYPFTKDNKVLLYFSASNQGHFSEKPGAVSRIALASWRLDGFVSLDSASAVGTILTKKLIFNGSKLELNVDSSGPGNYVQVELLDIHGNVLPGFSRGECAPINTDDVHAIVSWNGRSEFSRLAGQTIQVKFYTKDAKLYALQFR